MTWTNNLHLTYLGHPIDYQISRSSADILPASPVCSPCTWLQPHRTVRCHDLCARWRYTTHRCMSRKARSRNEQPGKPRQRLLKSTGMWSIMSILILIHYTNMQYYLFPARKSSPVSIKGKLNMLSCLKTKCLLSSY